MTQAARWRPPTGSPPSCPGWATPGRTRRAARASPSPPVWWPTSSQAAGRRPGDHHGPARRPVAGLLQRAGGSHDRPLHDRRLLQAQGPRGHGRRLARRRGPEDRQAPGRPPGLRVAVLTKLRPEHNVSRVMHVIGDVEGKTAIIVDDIIDTAGTLVNGVQALIDKGAKEVYAACTPPGAVGPGLRAHRRVGPQRGRGHRHHPAARGRRPREDCGTIHGRYPGGYHQERVHRRVGERTIPGRKPAVLAARAARAEGRGDTHGHRQAVRLTNARSYRQRPGPQAARQGPASLASCTARATSPRPSRSNVEELEGGHARARSQRHPRARSAATAPGRQEQEESRPHTRWSRRSSSIPIKRNLLHVDLHEVDLAVEIEGRGGHRAAWALRPAWPTAASSTGNVAKSTCGRCPPTCPTVIELDLTELVIGHHLSVDALKAPDGRDHPRRSRDRHRSLWCRRGSSRLRR